MTAARVRVLVVDDDVALCDLACMWLGALGYEPTGVESAQEALRALEGAHFDILLTDVVMPGGMDGVELGRVARRTYPTLRVLHASGYKTVEDLEPGEAPMVLQKPYRKTDLARALDLVQGKAPP